MGHHKHHHKKKLAWRRLRLTIQPLTTVMIDTGVTGKKGKNHLDDQPPLGVIPEKFDNNLPPFNDPTGVISTVQFVPPPGTKPASRAEVIPLPPIANWVNIDMPTEPFWNPKTKTVWITLSNTNQLLPTEINVLVLDPAELGPGKADTYTELDDPNNGPF